MSFEPTDRPITPSSTWHLKSAPGDPLPKGFEPSRSPKPNRGSRPLVHLLLFFTTVTSTMFFGSLHYAGFKAGFEGEIVTPSFVQGAWYSFTILAILGAHEMGHYFACRYYGVDASLPYFLPAPILTGTIGAFIRIRQPIPTKSMLFDIGAAGPIAGFVVSVPALFLGLKLSRVVPLPDNFTGLTLGEPLLFQLAASLVVGEPPDGYALNLHPMGFAAWFGLLATLLNLFPIGQLDGGHISYATFGSWSTVVSLLAVAVVVGLTFVSLSWLFWAILVVVMTAVLGPSHPPTVDHQIPLDWTRRRVALATLVIFILCFTPAPIEVGDLIAQP